VFGAGVLLLGVASGALPGAGGGGSDVPPAEASQTGTDHAHAATNASADQAGTQDAGSRIDGLETAQANVTNPVASAVIATLIENTPGPGLGEQVSAAATNAASQNAASTPNEASDGLSRKP
jgi:hypothetical protein